jgi:hypothetical protein
MKKQSKENIQPKAFAGRIGEERPHLDYKENLFGPFSQLKNRWLFSILSRDDP